MLLDSRDFIPEGDGWMYEKNVPDPFAQEQDDITEVFRLDAAGDRDGLLWDEGEGSEQADDLREQIEDYDEDLS